MCNQKETDWIFEIIKTIYNIFTTCISTTFSKSYRANILWHQNQYQVNQIDVSFSFLLFLYSNFELDYCTINFPKKMIDSIL